MPPEDGGSEELKGGKRLRGRGGGAGEGKRPKGAGTLGRAAGSFGMGVAGALAGEGKKSRGEKQLLFSGGSIRK